MSTDPFSLLHPAIQYHVVNSLGWRSLRPAQRDAIAPILSGRNCLILAPTAGGKTEAAVIPILSCMVQNEWKALSVLYVCPLKALLNDLEHRLSRYAAFVGRTVQVWHGDVSRGAKAKALNEPPDILLTTPESLEGMLISPRIERVSWFGSLRVVVIDELHAFAGDDRGWHLRSVLGRVEENTPKPLQRIGLSATLSNPEELVRWVTRGEPGVVVGESAVPRDADITIDYVGSLDNAATVITQLYRGTKRLVFCDSRARVEELALRLREQDTRTFVSHSCLSATERHQAEKAFAEEGNCVIVATSTLELGIDVGDLDHVVQIDSPTMVSSFLQRMGRTGRREGARRNCLFLATSDESLLLACGLTRLWGQGYVEPVVPPPEPWHIVAQQAMAMVLQTGGIAENDCITNLEKLFPELPATNIQLVLKHMLAMDILWSDSGVLGFGKRGETLYGKRNYLDLISSFTSPMLFLVRYGSQELGYVDPAMLLSGQENETTNILLAGHSWGVTGLDWPSRTVWVQPAAERGNARWFGSSRALHYTVCQAVKETIISGPPAEVTLSKRAIAKLKELQGEVPPLEKNKTTVQPEGRDGFCWWTFAGGAANAVLAAVLKKKCKDVTADDFSVRAQGHFPDAEIAGFLAGFDPRKMAVTMIGNKKAAVKFAECLPEYQTASLILARMLDTASAAAIAAQTRIVIDAC